MLEGLEVSEIKLSKCKAIIDFRIDANTYKKDYILTDKLIRSNSFSTIDKLSTSVQNFGAYSLCNFINFTENGIPFLMTANVRQNFIDWQIERYVDEESHHLLSKSHCKKGQVLVTMAGEYLGRVAVYDKDFICSSNQAIAKVTVNKGENSYIISTFLNSKFGQNQINRFKTLTGQPNINMSLIKELLIPHFSNEISLAIESVVKKSEFKRNSSFETYTNAESILLQEIGLQNFEPSKDPVNIKSFKESFGKSERIDAEFYQSKYEDIENQIKKNCRCEILKEVIIKIETGEYSPQYFNINDKDNLTFYIRSTNIKGGKIEFDDDHYVEKSNFIRITKAGEIVTARVGSVGVFGEVRAEMEGAVYSDNVLCFTLPSNLIPSVYTLLFNTKYYFEFIERLARGSVQQRLNQETLKDLLIPIIDYKKQEQIAELVEESLKLKAESERLLELAKKAVEMAIEENEEKAMKYIKDNE